MSSPRASIARTNAVSGASRTRLGRSTMATAGLLRLLTMLFQAPLAYAFPLLSRSLRLSEEDDLPKASDDPDLWINLSVAIALVVLGGAFAGLTIALMGQDEIYLQVIATSGEGKERKHAKQVLNLLKRGKHWVLVTLLLSNVITNETLPIVLDRSLGGGWPAVVSSTVLIVIFGEVAPQSVCVRYGLTIGAWCSPFVLVLMWIMSPIAWPTAKLLDWLLGEDHGTVYKKAGLKTLVTLHKTMGPTPGERLNEDEVTIISAVLDLKDKPVGSIMTPMSDVFTMSADTVLDEDMMDTILSQGYSRIPIYAPDDPQNFIGMLLVKILITYDPEDCMRVRDFSLATLPETAPDTSCLDIVNFFQEGKSHMVLVSEQPGQDKGAIGVLTLEDVIEELIGEEIIDESDVYVDVHKAIRRIAPAPKMRFGKHGMKPSNDGDTETEAEASETTSLLPNESSGIRKASTGAVALENGLQQIGRSTSVLSKEGSGQTRPRMVQHARTSADIRQQFKHLGPVNAASRPRATKYTAVKIKPGNVTEVVNSPKSAILPSSSHGFGTHSRAASLVDKHDDRRPTEVGYGTVVSDVEGRPDSSIKIEAEPRLEAKLDAKLEALSASPKTAAEASAQAAQNIGPQPTDGSSKANGHRPGIEELAVSEPDSDSSTIGPVSSRNRNNSNKLSPHPSLRHNRDRPSQASSMSGVKTGGIVESVVDVGGLKKVVLEANGSTTSFESGGEAGHHGIENGSTSADRKESVDSTASSTDNAGATGDSADKKKKKKRSGKKGKKHH